MRSSRFIVLAMAAGALAATPAVVAQSPKKIVFVAGPKDHGGAGAHEYAKDLEALKGCLDRSNVPGLQISVVQGAVPDPSALVDVAAVVIESSGDRYEQERHVLFPFDGKTDHQTYDPETTKKLAALDALAKKGLGVVVLHYATYVNNNTARRYFLDWVSGYYESGYSRTVVTEWNVKPTNTTHPILRGVTPWTFRDEFYIALRTPDDRRRTSLLTATPTADTRMPAVPAAMVPLGGPPLVETSLVPESLVSWAVERDGGGRGFVMTGVHAHANLANDSYRRFLLNGILWAARGDVPPGGVVCALPAP
jgi:type 1 glutamine amidotransferase